MLISMRVCQAEYGRSQFTEVSNDDCPIIYVFLWLAHSLIYCEVPTVFVPAPNVLYCRALPKMLLVLNKIPSPNITPSPYSTFFTVQIICTAFSFLIPMLDG